MLGESRAEMLGHIITIDHTVTLNPEAAPVEGHASASTFKDLATGWVEREPVVHKTQEDTTSALQQLVGPREAIGLVHNNGNDEIRLACKALVARPWASAAGGDAQPFAYERRHREGQPASVGGREDMLSVCGVGPAMVIEGCAILLCRLHLAKGADSWEDAA